MRQRSSCLLGGGGAPTAIVVRVGADGGGCEGESGEDWEMGGKSRREERKDKREKMEQTSTQATSTAVK